MTNDEDVNRSKQPVLRECVERVRVRTGTRVRVKNFVRVRVSKIGPNSLR